MDDIKFKIAISLVNGIGPIRARNLISYVGGIEAVFKEKKSNLQKIPGIGSFVADSINFEEALKSAEEEMDFMQKNNVKAYFYLDNEYPKKLAQFDDSPILIYTKGDFDFNKQKYLSIVGTRSMTHYGQECCNKLVEDIVKLGFSPAIVSGLAFGVDYCAHTAALKNNLKTVAVLGHGFNLIYPAAHEQLANNIIQNGALISEYSFRTKNDAANFVKRNRIIAALSEATIVIESAKKGGSLLTAEYAVQYSRDVFAFSGRAGDKMSEGCNYLIKTNRAALIENADDLIFALQWEKNKNKQIQPTLFIELSDDEKTIVELLKNKDMLNVDFISYEVKMPINKVLAVLFNLEFKNVVKALPGRMYTLIMN